MGDFDLIGDFEVRIGDFETLRGDFEGSLRRGDFESRGLLFRLYK